MVWDPAEWEAGPRPEGLNGQESRPRPARRIIEDIDGTTAAASLQSVTTMARLKSTQVLFT